MEQTYVVADLFCGAGGFSTGAERAIADLGGRMNLYAINHWAKAIATHSANHPDALHLIQDVNTVDPASVVKGGYLDILIASPECTFHSRARGGKPIHDQGRMTPWTVMDWLTKLNVRTVLIENVPEFVYWGPLKNGRPDKAHKSEQFQAWFLTFAALGYRAEWRMLNAADYGDATTRVRFFLIARKDNLPITWPEPSHAKGDTGMFPGRLPWRGAREVIDWSNQGKSLLDHPKYIKKPLSPKTRTRIARGLQRFGGPLAPLYIRLLDLEDQDDTMPAEILEQPFMLNRHGENGSARVHSVEDPMPTATGRGSGYLVKTGAQPFHGSDRQHTIPRDVDDPIYTITTLTGGGLYLVEPEALPFVNANRNENAPKGMDEPVPMLTTAHGGGCFVVKPTCKPFMLGQQSGATPRSTDNPTPTIATDGAISLIQPSIIRYNGQSNAEDIDKPLSTILTYNKHGLFSPTLVEVNHSDSPQESKGRRTPSLEDPLPSPTTKRALGLASPILVQTSQTGGNGNYTRPAEDPIPTLTTRNDINIVSPIAEPYLIPNFGEREGQEPRIHSIEDPMPTVTSKGAGSLVTPLLKQLEEAEVDPRRLVIIDGHPYLLDIRFRMLQNSELARAMGFLDDETQYEFTGTVAEVTKQIGNAVPVNLAAALVQSILGQTTAP